MAHRIAAAGRKRRESVTRPKTIRAEIKALKDDEYERLAQSLADQLQVLQERGDDRAQAIEARLRPLVLVVRAGDATPPEAVEQLQPDVVVVRSDSSVRDMLEHIAVATQHARRPIALFTDRQAPADEEEGAARARGAPLPAGPGDDARRPPARRGRARGRPRVAARLTTLVRSGTKAVPESAAPPRRTLAQRLQR